MGRWIAIAVLAVLLLPMAVLTCAEAVEVDDLEQEVSELESSLYAVREAKEIDFGNGLRILELEKGWYEVRGKVQNVSDEPMSKVEIVVAFYCEDGSLDDVMTRSVTNLFPQEAVDWKIHYGNWTDQDAGLFDVYAIGNR